MTHKKHDSCFESSSRWCILQENIQRDKGKVQETMNKFKEKDYQLYMEALEKSTAREKE